MEEQKKEERPSATVVNAEIIKAAAAKGNLFQVVFRQDATLADVIFALNEARLCLDPRKSTGLHGFEDHAGIELKEVIFTPAK